MKLKLSWLLYILFIYLLFKGMYKYFGKDQSVFWSVIYFAPEYFMISSLFLKLAICELCRSIKVVYCLFLGLYLYAFIYEILIGIFSKNYIDYKGLCNNIFFSSLDIIILTVLLFVILFNHGRKIKV
jgi:hypothetical protein